MTAPLSMSPGKKGRAMPSARAAGPADRSRDASPPVGSIPIAGHMLREACHALCQSGKFETGQGGCAAICMSMLGSSRAKPHGCDYAMRVHEDLAASVLRATAAPDLLAALERVAGTLAAIGDLPSMRADVEAAISKARGEQVSTLSEGHAPDGGQR